METALFRKNIMRTLSVKPAKAGLKRLAGHNSRLNISHSALGVSLESVELVTALDEYILGGKTWSPELADMALEEMGDFGYYLILGCKYLKVSVPGSGKKSKLVGMTRGKALLQLMKLANDAGDLFHRNAYYGPVFIKNPDGTPSRVLDKEATDAIEAERNEKLRHIYRQMIHLYWMLCYEMFGEAPAYVFNANIAKLEKRFGKGHFSMTMQEARDHDAEMKALKLATKTVMKKVKKEKVAVAGTA